MTRDEPSIEHLQVRPATADDAMRVLELRKNTWQKRYVHPESGVTKELLAKKLAPLPPNEADMARYESMLSKPENQARNLVATLDGDVVGTLTYDTLTDGTGDIGVFVADEWNGRGVGDRLLDALIEMTDNELQVEIFARNPSRDFYRAHGFRESGPEGRHYFTDEVYLPTQVLKLVR